MTVPGWAWRVLRRLGLVIAATSLALGVTEVAVRWVGSAQGTDLVFMAPMGYPDDIYVKDGAMNYPNPAFTGTIQSFGYSVKPTFNAWGTRGPAPQTGVRTWISVGDSFTIALQVDDEETFSARLGQAQGVQVLNAGVDGYSTWKEALRTVQLGRAFPPEVVIANFFTGNDFFDNRQSATHTIAHPGLGPGEPGAPRFKVPVIGIAPPPPGWFAGMRDHSVLVAHWWAWKESRRARSGSDPNARRFRDELGLFTAEGQAKAAADTQMTEKALLFFADAAREVGARGVVAVMPPAFAMDVDTATRTFESVGFDHVTPDLDSAQNTAVAAAKATNLLVCDMMPVLRAAAAAGARPYLPFDGHLSLAGHQIVADALRTCIADGR